MPEQALDRIPLGSGLCSEDRPTEFSSTSMCCNCCYFTCSIFAPCVGDMREEDMVVLLSERAAREIYKKWVDTLNVSIRSVLIFTTCMHMLLCICAHKYQEVVMCVQQCSNSKPLVPSDSFMCFCCCHIRLRRLATRFSIEL